MEKNTKVLVISNNCFSQSDSNGRTLGNLFHGWKRDNLAQICVISKDPNWDICEKYYCIEDKEMLKSFLSCRKCKGRNLVPPKEEKRPSPIDTRKKRIIKKTLPRVILREMVWSGKRWKSKNLTKWVDDFNPNLIILQFGDSGFMINIATTLSKEKKIPLIVFNTEGYYFFPRNWYHKTKIDWLIFPLYKKSYRSKVKTMMNITSFCIYANQKLQSDYNKEFGNVPSSLIYTSSNMKPSHWPLFKDENPHIAYLGNLGLGRHTALIEVGIVLQHINTNYYIDVYGSANDEIKKQLENAPGVRYHGHVCYDKVKEIISKNDILFHVETEKGYRERQLQYAFSTKIADSISSGRCFILYAPRDLACYQYICDTGAGWLAENKKELEDVLRNVINNSQERLDVIARELLVASENHNYEKNALKFQEVLLKTC